MRGFREAGVLRCWEAEGQQLYEKADELNQEGALFSGGKNTQIDVALEGQFDEPGDEGDSAPLGGGSGGNAGTLSGTPPAWVGGGGGGAVALAVDTSMDAEMAVVESAFEIFGDGQ